jgi:SAM-dependent methyltransferase
MTGLVEERPASLPRLRPTSLFGLALRSATDRPGAQWWVCSSRGQRTPLDHRRWLAPADATDGLVVARCTGPTLDVGCGPGRLLVALRDAGLPALGLDVAPEAVRLARAAGGVVLLRSVFDRLPGEGRWSTALLLDGNVGIGGDPVALLARLAEILVPDGRAVVEVEAPGSPSGVERVRLEGDAAVSSWFPWARLSVDDADGVARAAGLAVRDVWSGGPRWFVELCPGGRA